VSIREDEHAAFSRHLGAPPGSSLYSVAPRTRVSDARCVRGSVQGFVRKAPAWTGSFGHLNQIACIVATREWRIDALKDRANELEKELSDLKARSKVLAKKLGQKSQL
jgi:hypothetical protein